VSAAYDTVKAVINSSQRKFGASEVSAFDKRKKDTPDREMQNVERVSFEIEIAIDVKKRCASLGAVVRNSGSVLSNQPLIK
jgi:hypothetical protein